MDDRLHAAYVGERRLDVRPSSIIWGIGIWGGASSSIIEGEKEVRDMQWLFVRKRGVGSREQGESSRCPLTIY